MLILAYDENDNIVHIKDAEKGKSYRCPDCGAEVRPRKGTKKTHHFFHMNAEDCGNSGESIVHKYYKEFIASQKIVNYNGIEMTVTNSKIEQTLPNLLTGSHIIADVMLELNGYKWIAVEVCYKNHKDENHVDVYNEFDMECFEVYVDMNEQRTDFEITGYEKIASVKQYGIKIETKITQQLNKEYTDINKKHDTKIMELKNEIVDFENDVLFTTGYFMCQLTNTYETTKKSYTFLELMREINYIVRKYKQLDYIKLMVKDYDDNENSYVFDIEFIKLVKNDTETIKEIVHKIEIIRTKYTGRNEYHSSLFSGSYYTKNNSVSYLYRALETKYCWIVDYDIRSNGHYVYKVREECKGRYRSKTWMKRKNNIKIIISTDNEDIKQNLLWYE